jgi:hypothetical protein
MRVTALSLSAMLLAGAACDLEEGPLMAPGQDCISCHDGGEANRWTAAGTWTRGARVSVTDANGKNVPMRGNDVGNFYTAESLTPPLTVSVDGQSMDMTKLPSGTLHYGGCNLCHTNGGADVIDVKNMAPGRDCLGCHRVGGVASYAPFTIAGTWKGPGHTVRVVDRNGVTTTLPTNTVGNFYANVTSLAFPLREVWVDGEQMDSGEVRDMRHASCNVCHGPDGEAHDD